MAEPFRDPLGYKRKNVTMVIISVVGIAVILAGVWVALKFNQYRNLGGVPKMSSAPAQIAISSPQHGSKIFYCDTIPVDVIAIGPTAYNSIELWLDGGLAGIQTASVEGEQPYITRLSYHPPEPGYHALMAVGVDENGEKVLSAQSVVLVVQDEEECNVDASEVTFPLDEGETTLDSYTTPVIPGSDEPVNPAGAWSGTLSDLATNLMADTKPAAPELAARPGRCAASLFIHDLSDNEEGFVVYRQTLNSPTWEKLATISSQSQVEWLEYADEGISGAVTYYVSAFNSQGVSKSNPVLVNIDPEGCSQDEEPTIVQSVDVVLQPDETQAGQVYCYISRDGENWSRWPTTGFFYPDEEGILPQSPIAVQRKLSDGSGQNVFLRGLMMECWGWQGGMLTRLGDLSIGEIQPDLAGEQMVFGNGIMAKLSVKTEAAVSPTSIFPVGYEGLFPPLKEFDPSMAVHPPLTPVDPDLPRVNLSLTFDPEVCGQHIPPEAQNALGKAMFCFPYPEYNLDKGASSPQPYLVWGFDLEPTCAGGMSESCKSYWELLSMAEETGGQVGFTITAIAPGIKHVWNVTDPNLTMFVVPPMACIGDLEYTVRIWYRPGSQGAAVAASPDQQISEVGEFELSPGEILYGPTSHPVKLPCGGDLFTPEIIEYYKEISVVFSKMYFYDLDDGGAEGITGVRDKSVELYGYLRVKAPSTGYWTTAYCFNEWTGNCDQEPYWAGSRHYLLVADWEEDDDDKLNTVMLGSNINLPVSENLAEWDLCMASSKHSCKYQGNKTGYAKENNILNVEVQEDDTLTISMRLVDYDELSDDDDVCIGSDSIPAEWFINMEKGETRDFVVTGDLTDSGRCTLYGEIEIISNWLSPIP